MGETIQELMDVILIIFNHFFCSEVWPFSSVLYFRHIRSGSLPTVPRLLLRILRSAGPPEPIKSAWVRDYHRQLYQLVYQQQLPVCRTPRKYYYLVFFFYIRHCDLSSGLKNTPEKEGPEFYPRHRRSGHVYRMMIIELVPLSHLRVRDSVQSKYRTE